MSFVDDNDYSRSPDVRAFWLRVYAAAFPGFVRAEYVDDLTFQLSHGDGRLWWRADRGPINFEEKAQGEHMNRYRDSLFLERWSGLGHTQDGWAVKPALKNQVLAYGFPSAGLAHIIHGGDLSAAIIQHSPRWGALRECPTGAGWPMMVDHLRSIGVRLRTIEVERAPQRRERLGHSQEKKT